MDTLATDKLTDLGRWFVALGVIGSGLQQLVTRNFVRLVPKLPEWIPAPALWACVVGVLLVAIGVAILSGKAVRPAATVLALLLLLMLVVLRLPEVVSNPMAGFMWTNPAKTLALCGGALILAGTAAGPSSATGSMGRKLMALAPVFLGIFLLICGVQHFVYAGFVDTLVPAWIPPNPRFWTYFAGVALAAGGVGVALPPIARLAGILSGVMIFLWVILLHIPRAAADWSNAGETSAIFEALALSGVCFLVAGCRPARGKR